MANVERGRTRPAVCERVVSGRSGEIRTGVACRRLRTILSSIGDETLDVRMLPAGFRVRARAQRGPGARSADRACTSSASMSSEATTPPAPLPSGANVRARGKARGDEAQVADQQAVSARNAASNAEDLAGRSEVTVVSQTTPRSWPRQSTGRRPYTPAGQTASQSPQAVHDDSPMEACPSKRSRALEPETGRPIT